LIVLGITTTRVTKTVKSTSSPSTTRELKTRDIDSIWDEELLKELLDQSSSYEERRKIRARLRQVMAEKEESKIQVKSDEASKIVTTTQSITNARTISTAKAVPAKPISPFAKFRQLDKQVSTQSSPKTFK
jgi:superfamily II DNA helicase RecQ